MGIRSVSDYSNIVTYFALLEQIVCGVGSTGDGPFNLIKCHHQGCLNNLIHSNLGWCCACRAHFFYDHEERLLPENSIPIFRSSIMLFCISN